MLFYPKHKPGRQMAAAHQRSARLDVSPASYCEGAEITTITKKLKFADVIKKKQELE
jgi:hypothetical protein